MLFEVSLAPGALPLTKARPFPPVAGVIAVVVLPERRADVRVDVELPPISPLASLPFCGYR